MKPGFPRSETVKRVKGSKSTKRCNWHLEKKLGYINWHHWAEEQTKKGIKQVQCKQCNHFFFPSEFGDPTEQQMTKEHEQSVKEKK
jgi:hypothetical protein